MHAAPLRGELSSLYEFRLSGRGPAQYLALLAVIVCTVFTIGVALFLATRRQYPRRWRWVLASLVGAGAVSVNWTTGAVASRIVTVQLFAASAVRANEYAPWILSFSVPIGALIALARYRQWKSESSASAAGTTPATDTPTAEPAA
jgi:hypothetical protein